MNDSSTVAPVVRTRLHELEATIERGLTTFVQVGNAIREIRDSRLYRETHATFEAYCRERWGWSRNYANKQIVAADTAALVGTIVPISNEAQARALTPLAKENPDEARSLWSEVRTEHGDETTAKHVEKAVKEVKEARAIRSQLPQKVRSVVEASDPEDHSLSRSPAQLRHLMDISLKRGEDAAADTALRVADGEFKSTFEAYPETQQDRMNVHYTSETGEWYTPSPVVERVQAALGGIDLDPCADKAKSIPARFHLTQDDDGLSVEWAGKVYMNPPYGSEIGTWIRRLKDQHENGDVTAAVALVPARTDTEWFATLRDYPRCFIRGRLRFSGHANSAPFPSCAFYLGPDTEAFAAEFAALGDTFARLG